MIASVIILLECVSGHAGVSPQKALTFRLDNPSVASTIGKAAIVVMVMFSYPLQVHPCRASIDAVLRWRLHKTSRHAHEVSPPGAAPLLGPQNTSGKTSRTDSMGETRFALITTTIIVLSYIVAMTVSSLGKVLAYVGSTGSTSISFILPGLFFYKISSPDSLVQQRLLKEDDDESEQREYSELDNEDLSGARPAYRVGWRRQLERRLSLALAIYGIVVMVVCLVSNTYFNAKH